MTETDFLRQGPVPAPIAGQLGWEAPSNIALVKYWGKKGNQIPANPSISFTLDTCRTTTKLSFEERKGQQEEFSFSVYLDGERQIGFEPKVATFMERILAYQPFLKNHHFTIETSNSFPHSSGIASSASGMAALALCFVDLEQQLYGSLSQDEFIKKASFLARLGSGSACRSLQGPLVEWGVHEGIMGSTDLYGIPYPGAVHDVFKDYQDSILLVHKGQKQVGSTQGHGLINGHPFAEARFAKAHQNMDALATILEQGDLEGFMALVEGEALMLHALMMSGSPYFMLMKPNTLAILEKIWQFRGETGTPVCFTLDAGANVHVLYPKAHKDAVITFIKEELVVFCEEGQYICDENGLGAKELKL